MMFRSVIHSPRSLTRFEDPFTVVQRAFERLGDIAPTEAAPMPVRVDVQENEKAFHITADLPGLTDKEVEVIFDDGVLTIRGEKKVERDEAKGTWHVTERSTGSFAKRIGLPSAIDEGKIEASFDKGVLSVSLPKQPEEKTTAKKITIKAA